MAKKHIIIKNHNGTDWDILYPETEVTQVITADGQTLDTELGKKVDKVTGKQLSTNDFTNVLKTKLETGIDTELGKKVDKVSGKQLSTNDFTNTLKTKLETGIDTQLSKKVDKVSGKQLSTNDFTTPLKTKLENLNETVQVSTTEPTNKTGLWFEVKNV